MEDGIIKTESDAEIIAFVLIPDFSMYALASASEPFRVANRLNTVESYDIKFVSIDVGPAIASNGVSISTHTSFSELSKDVSRIIVIAGFEPLKNCSPKTLSLLQDAARQGALLGAVDTGAYLLAKAGLLAGRKCTLHWESIGSFREEFPNITVVNELFVEDGRFVTSAGGAGALDMALQIIWLKHGYDLMTAVAEQFIYNALRSGDDHQRMSLRHRLMTSNPHLIKAVRLMEERCLKPYSIATIAKESGISQRELNRVFKRNLNVTPQSFYRGVRLERASRLLNQTDMSVLDIAVLCGFSSASLFSRNFKDHFGMPPTQARGNRHQIQNLISDT